MKVENPNFMGLKRWTTALIALLGVILFLPHASQAKTYKLSLAAFNTPRASLYARGYVPWAKEIEKRTDGRVKINLFPSQSLVKGRDSYDAVVNGVADISYGINGWSPGRFPLSNVFGLPFMSPESLAGTLAANDLVKKSPEMAAEFKDVRLLFLWVSQSAELHTVNKTINKMADLKGMKIACRATNSSAVSALGAVPMDIPLPDYYMALEKGVVDGTILPWGAFKAFKIIEVTKYHTSIQMGGTTLWTAMNKKTWNRLPKDIQEIMNQVTKEMMPHLLSKVTTAESEKAIKMVKGKGREIISLPPSEMKKWRDTVKPIWSQWAQSMEAKGLPGKAILKDADGLVKMYLKK